MIKKYRLTLKTLTNLHIGLGETTQTFECFIDNDSFSFIDIDKLTNELIKNNLEDKFINEIIPKGKIEERSNEDRNMRKILNKLGYQNYNMFKMYTIKGKTSLDSNDRIIYKPIERFIRNKEKEVYVPGSSVKGFISNILKLLNKKDKNNVHISNRLRISDSKPISVNNLFISRVSYYRELYGSKNQRALPKDGQSNYVEFIKPGVEIEFNVTIDTDYINLEKFEEELKFFNNNYFDMYQSYYEVSEKPGQFDDLSNNDAMYEGSVFRLGKYTNFLTKTNHLLNKFKGNDYELYYLLKKENQYQRIFNFPKKLKNKLQKQVDFEKRYPLALKLSYNPDGYYRENGICSFRFEEIK